MGLFNVHCSDSFLALGFIELFSLCVYIGFFSERGVGMSTKHISVGNQCIMQKIRLQSQLRYTHFGLEENGYRPELHGLRCAGASA